MAVTLTNVIDKKESTEEVELYDRLKAEIKNGVLNASHIASKARRFEEAIGMQVSLRFMTIVGKLLKNNENITALSIPTAGIEGFDEEVIIKFAEAINANKHLGSLDVRGNFSYHRGRLSQKTTIFLNAIKNNTIMLTIEYSKALEDYLVNNKHLKGINIEEKLLNNKQTLRFSEFLYKDKTLTRVAYSGIFTMKSMGFVALALRNNPNLTDLSLQFYSHDNALELLALVLESDVALTSLKLSYGGSVLLLKNSDESLEKFESFENKELCAIAKALQKNTNLKTLKIIGNLTNLMNEETITTFGQSMKINQTLNHLSLTDFKLDIAKIKKFLMYLQYNNSLISLDITGNSAISDLEGVANILSQNYSLLDVKCLDPVTKNNVPRCLAIENICQRNARLKRNWSFVSVLLASYRANRESSIKSSILSIMQYYIFKFADIEMLPQDIGLQSKTQAKNINIIPTVAKPSNATDATTTPMVFDKARPMILEKIEPIVSDKAVAALFSSSSTFTNPPANKPLLDTTYATNIIFDINVKKELNKKTISFSTESGQKDINSTKKRKIEFSL